jgi:hypothetical protein
METKNSLQDGQARGYIGDEEFTKLIRLTIHASKATIRLRRYLRTCKPRTLIEPIRTLNEVRGGSIRFEEVRKFEKVSKALREDRTCSNSCESA